MANPMARIVRFHETGGPEVLRIERIELEPLRAGEVRIAVKALGLNRAESRFRSGRYLETPTLPARLGYEAAGTVEAVGEGVEGLEVGDAVSTIPAFSQDRHGVYGDTATVPAAAVAKHPATLSWVEAAALWAQYLTAYGALIEIARLEPGDTVLIPAASSSVGIASIQIANLVGAAPIALTRGRAKRGALPAGRDEPVVELSGRIVRVDGRPFERSFRGSAAAGYFSANAASIALAISSGVRSWMCVPNDHE